MCRYLLFTEFNASRILCLLGIIKHSFVHIIQCPDSEKKTTDHEKWFKCLQKLNAFSALADCVGLGAGFVQNIRVLQPVLCTKYCFVQNIQTIRNIALYKIFKISLCTKYWRFTTRASTFIAISLYSLYSFSLPHLPSCKNLALWGGKSIEYWNIPKNTEYVFLGIFKYSIAMYYILHQESGYYKCIILPDCTIHVLQGGKSFD